MAIREEKEIKGIHIKKEVKLSLTFSRFSVVVLTAFEALQSTSQQSSSSSDVFSACHECIIPLQPHSYSVKYFYFTENKIEQFQRNELYFKSGSDFLSLSTFMHWRRKWHPTPVFLPGESQGRRSLVGCRLWGHTESDTTNVTQQYQQQLSVQSRQIQRSLQYCIKQMVEYMWKYSEHIKVV